MYNDLAAMRECGTSLESCGQNVTNHLDEHSESLTVSGNTGFTTVSALSTITNDWTEQLGGFSRRLHSIGRVVTLAANGLETEDTDNGLNINRTALPPQAA